MIDRLKCMFSPKNLSHVIIISMPVKCGTVFLCVRKSQHCLCYFPQH